MTDSTAKRLARKVRHIWRSSITGRFVTKLFAKDHPDTTVEEKVRD